MILLATPVATAAQPLQPALFKELTSIAADSAELPVEGACRRGYVYAPQSCCVVLTATTLDN